MQTVWEGFWEGKGSKGIRLIGLLSEATDDDLLAKPDSFNKFTALMDGRRWGSLKAIHRDLYVVRPPAVFS